MTRQLLTVVFCILGTIGCATGGSASPPTEHPSLPVVSSQAYKAMIVPRFVNFPESWTPTSEEVTLAEPKVQGCVLTRRRGLRSTLSRYVRHYSGWTVDGRRTLRVQFYDTRHFHGDTLTHPNEVVDGDGETYFVVSLDLESATCSF